MKTTDIGFEKFEEDFYADLSTAFIKHRNENLSYESMIEHKDCDSCKHSYEDETLDGHLQLYCIKRINDKDGSAVSPWDCCYKFEDKE